MSHRLQVLQAFLLASALGSGAVLAADPAPATSASPAKLDLSAPPVEHVMPRAELRSMLAEEEPVEGEDVRVEQPHYRVPVPGGLFALPWALLHPTQAWRIFTPVLD